MQTQIVPPTRRQIRAVERTRERAHFGGIGQFSMWPCSFSSGAAPFNPSTISSATCTSWFKADTGFSGSAWTDGSGLGNNMSQATGSKQPSHTTADSNFNGHDSVTFDGVDDSMSCTSAIGSVANAAFYIVARRVSYVTGGELLTHSTTTDWQTAGACIAFYDSDATHFSSYRNNAQRAVLTHVGTGVTFGAKSVWSPNSDLKMNGTSATQVADASGNFASASLTVGAGHPASSSPGSWSNYAVAEIIVYSGTVSGADDTAIRSYLSTKYSISF